MAIAYLPGPPNVVFSCRRGRMVAKVGSSATWQMCLAAVAVVSFFFIVLAIKYLKVSFYAYFAGREPHYQIEREREGDTE